MQRSSRDNRGRNWSNDNDIISFHEPVRRASFQPLRGSCVNRWPIRTSHQQAGEEEGAPLCPAKQKRVAGPPSS